MPPPPISPALFHLLDKIADSVNPVLTVWALLVLWRHSHRAQEGRDAIEFGRALRLWIVAIAVVYVIAHLNRWLHVWPGHKYFPSGHVSYAACVATLGATLERRSLLLTVPLIALYSVLIVRLGYHVWIDILGALLLAPPLTLAIAGRAGRRVGV